MKKLLLTLLALCMVLSVVLVACNDPEEPVESGAETTTEPTTTEPAETDPVTTEPVTEPTTTEPVTEPDTSETETETETEKPADPVTTCLSFDELSMITDGNSVGFFTPGQSASWDKIANVEDYNVDTIKVWGWVGFFAEELGQFGYQIGDAEPVFGEFTFATEDAVIAAASGSGAKSASRFAIMIPVEYVGGEGIVVKALARDAVGTVETLVEFTLNKPANPNAPVAFVPAADMAATIPGSPGINGCTLSADGNYVTIDTIGQGDPYYQLPMLNGKGLVATHAVIKYRSTSTHTRSEMFVGSGAGPNGQGDNIQFDLTCDGKWNLMIVDLSAVSAVADGVVNYLRWDPFAGAADATIDMAYIGLFNSAEAAVAYDAQFKGVLIDTLNVPTSAWTVTGHSAEIVPAEGHGLSGMVAAGGVAEGALLHQGYIALGEINLAEMSKVVIYFGVDGSQVTIDAHAANAQNRIILTSADQAMTMSPTEDVVIAAADYTELGWAVHAVEIDLTGVDYNGPVFVTYDTLPGTFMLFSSVEFTYDPDYVAPIVKPEFGSEELPLTVTETLNAVAGLEEGAATENQYYTTGVVTEIGQTGSYYKNVYFTDGEQTMLIYTLNPMEGMPELKVGDTITVFGYIKNYNGTIEFASKYVDDAQVYVYIVAHEAAPVEEPAVFEGNWHTSVDSFMYCVQDDFSDVVTFAGAATNNANGTTIANASGSLASVTAKYVYFAGGWIAVDGYSLENWACDIIAADGTVLKTVELGLKEAEQGVLDHVANNMGYAGVPNRLGNESEIIALGEYAGQTVKVVYRVGAGEYTINLIELEVIVP